MKQNSIIQFFIGTDGGKSSKRLFLFILIVLFVTYFIANLFFGKVLKDSLEENLFYLIIVMFVGVAGEQWRPKKLANKNTINEPEKPEP